jgi:hypothetical protein
LSPRGRERGRRRCQCLQHRLTLPSRRPVVSGAGFSDTGSTRRVYGAPRVESYASGPGVWFMHAHDERAVTNNGMSPGGDLTTIVSEGFMAPDGLPRGHQPQALLRSGLLPGHADNAAAQGLKPGERIRFTTDDEQRAIAGVSPSRSESQRAGRRTLLHRRSLPPPQARGSAT